MDGEASSEVDIFSEDEEFVAQLTGDQLRFFTAEMDPRQFRTPLEEAEADDRVQVDAPRPVPRRWVEESVQQSRLPIKRRDGTVVPQPVTVEDIEEHQRLQERRQAREAAAAAAASSAAPGPKTKKKRRKLGDPEPGDEASGGSGPAGRNGGDGDDDSDGPAADDDDLDRKLSADELRQFQDRLDQIPNKQAEIRKLSTEVLASPEEKLGDNMVLLLALCVDDSLLIKQLAVLSCAAIFADLMPAYRIREDNEERASDGPALSKEVKKLRRYERVFLHNYRAFVELLGVILSLRKPNPMTDADVALYENSRKQRKFHVKSLKALHQMQLIATRALNKIFLSNPSFNHGESLVKLLIPCADRMDVVNGEAAQVAVETIGALFEKRHELEQIYFTVLEMGRYVKSKKFRCNPRMLATFLRLSISDAIADIDIKNTSDRNSKQHVTKKEKKARKFGKMVDNKVREAEAERRRTDVERFQRQMAQSMFLTYFRVIKSTQNSPLLPVVLQGVARWCHLLNVDFMFEIVSALLKLLQQGNLPLQSALYCAITAFQALKNSGDVFRVDLSSYYHFVYSRLLQMPFVRPPSQEEWQVEPVEEVAAQCLQLMLSSKSYRMANRSAAFCKRLATVALHSTPGAAIGLLQLCRRIIATDSRLDQLVDPEEAGTVDVFSPEVDDPDNCNPFSTSLFELLLLQEHYHPHVKMFATQALKNEALSPHDPRDFMYSYDWDVQIFNPPVEEPPPTRFDKKLRKLERYDEAKRQKFSDSLMYPPPMGQPSPFESMNQRLAREWLNRKKN